MTISHRFSRFFSYYVYPAYLSALAGFLSSLLRDFSILTYLPNPDSFFQIIYLASSVSVLAINAISLSGSKASLPNLLYLIFTSLFGFLIYLNVTPARPTFPQTILVSILALLWIIGAFEANDAFLEGQIFFSKTRESISSLATSLLAFAHSNLLFVVLLGPIISILPYKAKAINRSYSALKSNPTINYRIVYVAILTSIAPIAIQLWAYALTHHSGNIYGISFTLFTRISIYIFQFISIGSSLLVLLPKKLALTHSLHIQLIALSTCTFSLFTVFSSNIFLITIAPLSLSLTHISLILLSSRFTHQS